jgi:hypothetical protein
MMSQFMVNPSEDHINKPMKEQQDQSKDLIINQSYIDPFALKEEGWARIDALTRSSMSNWQIGGEGLSASLPSFDGTNYQQWANRIEAYLQTQELWEYVNGNEIQPEIPEKPINPVREEDEDGKETTAYRRKVQKYDEAVTAYNTAVTTAKPWLKANTKALGIISLKLVDKLQYLKKPMARDTWLVLKEQFDQQGPAATFIDFKAVINFKFDDRKDLSVQIVELNTKINRLASRGFHLDDKMIAMIILTGLTSGWDSIQGSILVNIGLDELSPTLIMPILQEEWNRCKARNSRNKTANFAQQNI